MIKLWAELYNTSDDVRIVHVDSNAGRKTLCGTYTVSSRITPTNETVTCPDCIWIVQFCRTVPRELVS